MPSMTIQIPEDLNKNLEMYKIQHGTAKSDQIIELIRVAINLRDKSI